MLIKTPKVIYDHLSKYVVGQHDVKRMLSNLYFLHSLRVLGHRSHDKDFKKSVGLIYGASGCGKSYSIEILAKAAKLPYFKVNAKDITLPGYKGTNLDQHLSNYIAQYENTDMKNDIPYGIFHIDEFDKISAQGASSSGSLDEWGTNLQYNLLSFIEGAEMTVKAEGMGAKSQVIRTHNMLVILTGSFAHIESEKREGSKGDKELMGFASRKLAKPSEVIQTQLIKQGVIKELVGRITCIEKVKRLTRKQAKDAFLNKKNSIYRQYEELLGGITDFKLSPQKINKIVDSALKSDIGARGLHAALEKELEELVFTCSPDVPGMSDPIEDEDDVEEKEA